MQTINENNSFVIETNANVKVMLRSIKTMIEEDFKIQLWAGAFMVAEKIVKMSVTFSPDLFYA